jgi:hypothetical protein
MAVLKGISYRRSHERVGSGGPFRIYTTGVEYICIEEKQFYQERRSCDCISKDVSETQV